MRAKRTRTRDHHYTRSATNTHTHTHTHTHTIACRNVTQFTARTWLKFGLERPPNVFHPQVSKHNPTRIRIARSFVSFFLRITVTVIFLRFSLSFCVNKRPQSCLRRGAHPQTLKKNPNHWKLQWASGFFLVSSNSFIQFTRHPLLSKWWGKSYSTAREGFGNLYCPQWSFLKGTGRLLSTIVCLLRYNH